MSTAKHVFNLTIPSVIVSTLFLASYLVFANYKPKALSEVREVKGYRSVSENVYDLPFPDFASSIGDAKGTNSKQITFQTDKSPSAVKQFYDNVLLADDWRIKKEGYINEFIATDYRKEEYVVSLLASYNAETKLTFASVEISKVD